VFIDRILAVPSLARRGYTINGKKINRVQYRSLDSGFRRNDDFLSKAKMNTI